MSTNNKPKAGPIPVLFIDGNRRDVLRISKGVQKNSPDEFVITHALTMSDGIDMLKGGSFQLILLGISGSDEAELESAKRVLDIAPALPVIVMTGTMTGPTTGAGRNEMAIAFEQRSGYDCMAKSHSDGGSLARVMRHALERCRLVSELEDSRTSERKLDEQFRWHLSHDLRTPLSCIHQFGNILLNGLAGPLIPEQREYIAIMLRNATQLRSILDNLFDAHATRARPGEDSGSLDAAT